MWPCGVIVHISELFMAECKTQVYGQLHDLLWTHPSTAQQFITSFEIYMYRISVSMMDKRFVENPLQKI